MSLQPSMDRNAPAPVEPVRLGGLRFEAPAEVRGTVIAIDAKSGKEQWRLLVVDTFIDDSLEADVQDVFVTRLEPVAEALRVHDEHGRVFLVDVERRTARLARLPVRTQVMEWSPGERGWRYLVRLRIPNGLAAPLKLDPFSVAAKGVLHNDLFTVEVDGQPVPYSGELVSRLPVPEQQLIVVEPGEAYEVQVDLSEAYAVPLGAHDVAVGFEHTNHTRPGFLLSTSAPHVVRFGAAAR